MQNFKTTLLISIAFFYFLMNAFAQNTGTISGSINTNSGKQVAGATVSLLRAKDSATLKLSVADKNGDFLFEKLSAGKYLVSVTVIGHQKSFTNPVEITASQENIQLPVITLSAVTKSLSDVSVTAKRPLIEQKIDRTVVNVDAAITNIGTSAMDVLEKSPGISVDREGNISLKGKEGVLVMIDGRPTQLAGADLANMLRNMSSNQMDQIEIMTNPPARYDAAGNAGIINIKTKKTLSAGYNGSVSATYTQGKYPKTNAGLIFNYRTTKFNLFSNLSHSYRKGFEDLTIQRNIFNTSGNILQNYFDQSANKIAQANFYTGRIGLDFFASKKTTLGIVINGTTTPSTVNNENSTVIMNPARQFQSVTKANVGNSTDMNSFSTNLNLRTILDSKGKELTADLDYLNYGFDNRLFMVNSYFDGVGNPIYKADTLQGRLPQDIKVYGARIDYLHPINKTTKFEAGLKTSLVKTDNDANYDSILNGQLVHDFNRSNHFIYEENVNAAYVNLSTSLSKKISAQFGLRLENTNAKGRQITTGENFDRNYTQLFPTAYFQYKLSDKSNLGLNYGRRVRRPNYASMNPFIRFIDRYTYGQGNPNLKPQISDNVELSWSFKNILSATLNYTYTSDVINSVLEQKGQEAVSKPQNIASLEQYGLSVTANNTITKWWTSNININAFINKSDGIVNNTPIALSAESLIANVTQQFKLSPTVSAELNARFRTPWIEGVMRANAIAFMGAGISKNIMKNKGTLRLAVRDLFHSQIFKATSKYGNVDFYVREVNDTQQFSLGFTYRFSKGKKIAATKRTAGSANEEQERIN